MKLMLHWSQKLHWKLFWTFSVKVIRPAKITIWRRHFRNKLFSKMKLSKNVFYKSWTPELIFSNEKNREIQIIFDIEKWLRKSEFCNFVGLITSSENVQKKLNVIFVISGVHISFILKSIYSINYRHSNVFNPLGSWDTDNHGINIKYLPNDFSLTKDVVKKK